MKTPEFLLWSLAERCPLRELIPVDEPDQVERHLRAAQCYSNALREGRIWEGIAVAPPLGFRVADSLALYGGEQSLAAACDGCPANTARRLEPAGMAGCFGLLPLPENAALVHAAAAEALVMAGAERRTPFPATTPAWYGLWMQSPLGQAEARHLTPALATVFASSRAGDDFLAALAIAGAQPIPLHVMLYPPGEVVGTWWRLAPHCPRCRAVWHEPKSRRCGVCQYAGHPAPDKKRHARGTRPYFPLDRLLGAEKAVEFLGRYERRGTASQAGLQ